MKRFAAYLISFVLLLAVTACNGDAAKTAKSIDPVASPVYPKAIAFDDFKSHMALQEKNPVDESFVAGLNDFSYETSSLLLKTQPAMLQRTFMHRFLTWTFPMPKPGRQWVNGSQTIQTGVSHRI